MKLDQFKRSIFPLVVFIISLGVYLYTLCPTVYWDDAGELIAACYTLGIPHPPGHPLYAILGWLFTRLPVGSPAYRVNLMSAFFGALTSTVVFLVVRELVEHEEKLRRFATFAGLIAALSAAFSLILWDQSVVAETTTLHSFFIMVVTLLVFRIEADGPNHPRLTWRLFVFSFIYGLSFTNHVAGLFFVPSVSVILVLALRWKAFKPARLATMFFLFLLGFSVYAYLPIRSRFNPAIDWGNPETLHNFLWVVTARQYSSNLLKLPSYPWFVIGLRSILETFRSNLTLLGCGFALAGALSLWKTRKPVAIYGVLVVLILFFVSLNGAFIFAYLLPLVLMLAIWAGYGVAFLCEKTVTGAGVFTGWRQRILAGLGYCMAACVVLVLFFTHFTMNDKRHYCSAREYGVSLLSSLPQDAILITGSADPLFISWYLQYCENYRTDVKVITRNGMTRPGYLNQVRSRYPEVNIPNEFDYGDTEATPAPDISGRKDELPWYAISYFRLLWELNAAKFPVFWEGIETGQFLTDRFIPHDLVFQILPPNGTVPENELRILNVAEIEKLTKHDPTAAAVYENHVFNYAVYYQLRNDIPTAERYYRDTLRICPGDPRALNNLGAILVQNGKGQEAFEKFLQAFRIDPDDPTSNHNVGQALMEQGKIKEATPYFRRVVACKQPAFEDYLNLGVCYASLGKNEPAVEMLERAHNLKPDSPEVLSSLGVVYLRLGRTENARKLLETALEIEPDNSENWYNMACLQALEGNEVHASASLWRALTIDHKKTYELASNDRRLAPILDSLLKKQ